jgi:hypothetical protein
MSLFSDGVPRVAGGPEWRMLVTALPFVGVFLQEMDIEDETGMLSS